MSCKSLVVLFAVALSFTAVTGAADAAGGYYVTFVARACPSYGDIYANAARTDGIQSLEKLGRSSRFDKIRALVTRRMRRQGSS